jgi:hypothetical protein
MTERVRARERQKEARRRVNVGSDLHMMITVTDK